MQRKEGTAYFAWVISYLCNMFIEFTTGLNLLKTVFFLIDDEAN